MSRYERVADLEAELAAHRLERLPPAIRVEADDVATQQAPVDHLDDLVRQHRPAFRPDPRDVREVRNHRLGQPSAHEARRQVQVVVVEENCRARVAGQLLDDCVGECLVDRGVPRVPGRSEVALGLVLELPQPVLNEPERWVGDDVVVEVERGRVVRDEPQPVARAVWCSRIDRPFGRDHTILVRERACDPGDVVMRHERRERRHEPAGAAPGDALSALADVPDRAAVGDHDQLPPRLHGEEPRAASRT